jgi:uncharacterized protein (DUF2147 family)
MNKILIIVLLFLSGCATQIVSYNESKPVNAEKLGAAYSKYKNKTETTATVIIVRDSGIVGSAGTSDFFIGGELIAKIYTGESVTLYLEPNEYLLGVGPGASFSLAETKKYMEEQVLNAQSGKTYYYRISIVMGKGMVLQRTSQVQ